MAFRRLFHRYGVLMLGLGMMAGSARATTTYSTAATFANAAATAGLVLAPTITFTTDSCSLCTTLTDTTDPGDVTFTASYQMSVETAFGWAGDVLEDPSGAGSSISIAPGNAFYAFGFYIVTVSGPAFPVSVTFNDGTAESFGATTSGSAGSAVFFGDISTAPITGVEVSLAFNGLNWGIDDVQVGSQSAAPEGSTNLLIGSGLIGLYWLRRRRRHQPVPA